MAFSKTKVKFRKVVGEALIGVSLFSQFSASNCVVAKNSCSNNLPIAGGAFFCLASSYLSYLYLKKLPDNDKVTTTVFLFGSPSTGKSNRVNKLTGANFDTGEKFGVTTSVSCVDTYLGDRKFKFCDTPGLHRDAKKDELRGIEEAKRRLPEANIVMVGINLSKKLEEQSIREIMQSLKDSKSKNKNQRFIFDLARSEKIKDPSERKETINSFKQALGKYCDELGCVFVVTDTDSEESMLNLKNKLIS